ncbi:hypothetical protein FKP32DRAFT_1560798 [Trametes sanguinea]|nr:hypothetical protein FKP32DRAFT_1560798 [Trametes sanguinea]
MLNFAVDYRKAINTLCTTREHGLRAFELSRTDWAIASELRDVLKIFKDATLFFSRDTLNLAMVIPAMDHIDATLTDYTLPGNTLQPPVSAALRLAKKTLNKYYKLSDLSATYRIAMVLHPSHKLRYFENARWPATWIKSARDMVQEEFDGYYAQKAPEHTADEEEEDDAVASDSGDTSGGPARLHKVC